MRQHHSTQLEYGPQVLKQENAYESEDWTCLEKYRKIVYWSRVALAVSILIFILMTFTFY